MTTAVAANTDVATPKKPSLPPRAQLGIAIGAVLLIALVGWFLVVSPKKSHAADLEEQVQAARDRLTQAQLAARQEPAPPVETGDLFRLAKAMPDDVDLSGILLELNRVATDTGIAFESVGFGGAATVGAYQIVPISLEFKGNFYSLSDFLFRLRNLVTVRNGQLSATGRLVSVDSVNFGEDPKRSFPHIRATLQANAFVFGTGAPAPAPATPAAPADPNAPAPTTPADPNAPATTTPAAPADPNAPAATTPATTPATGAATG